MLVASLLGWDQMNVKDRSRAAPKLHIEGRAPLLPVLAGTIDEAPALMDALAAEFAPTAAQLATQQAYWVAFNGWMTDRLSGPIMDGETTVEALRGGAWAVYATAYWGGMELRENWGMPAAIERLGIVMAAPYAEVQQTIADEIARRLAALEAGGERCLELLPVLLHDDSGAGALWSTAYNAGCQVVKVEDPPVGQRRPHRTPRPGAVRINARDFMRVDYELPTPRYLKIWRSAFERAVTANPTAYEALIAGEPGQTDLRDIWTRGVGFGNTTWGGGANDMWTDAYFDDVLQWSTVVNFGLEAVSLAAFVAVINQDPEAARFAVMGNALYAGMSSGWLIGLLDTGGKLPAIVAV
jgi:hypothetical protein